MARLLHLVSHREEAPDPEEYLSDYWDGRRTATQRFFARLPHLEVADKTVVDVGCGVGYTIFHVAESGARRAVGVDIDPLHLDFANHKLQKEYPHLTDRVELRLIHDWDDLGAERFDVVLSQDSFEHLENPVEATERLRGLLADEGLLVIGFGGVWGSPYGGHLNHVTSLPYAHLIFPERVVMHERMRFRPEQRAHRYEDFVGGLNRMTVERFEEIMRATGMECVYYATNVSDHKAVKLMRLLAKVPVGRRMWRHLFTANIYSVWRESAAKRATSSSPPPAPFA